MPGNTACDRCCIATTFVWGDAPQVAEHHLLKMVGRPESGVVDEDVHVLLSDRMWDRVMLKSLKS